MPAAFEIKGAKGLMHMLRELPRSSARKVNRRAVNLGTTPILRAVKAECPTEHGDLRKAMIKKVTNAGMRANGIVGADEDYVGEDGQKPSNYDHLVNYGHVNRTMTPPNPFMQRGWDSSIREAQAKYQEAMAGGLETEAERLAQRK